MALANYKQEIGNTLRLTQRLVTEIIYQIESNYDWKNIHKKTILAIAQLKYVTQLLTQDYLRACLLKKHKNIKEIIKVYRHLH